MPPLPICTSLDQWHMGPNLNAWFFLGLERERVREGKKRRGQQGRLSRWRQWAGLSQANPYWKIQHSGGE